MPKPAFAAALPLLLLAACGDGDRAAGQDNAVEAEAEAIENSGENSGSSDTGQPAAPADGAGDPVPPPDAVSHPDGYLPPAPGEAEPANANAPAPGQPPPATEDEYIRNAQAGR